MRKILEKTIADQRVDYCNGLFRAIRMYLVISGTKDTIGGKRYVKEGAGEKIFKK